VAGLREAHSERGVPDSLATAAAQSPAFCAQLAEVEVDRETGHVTLHELVAVQDAGRAINPDAVSGQMMGGAAQPG
jgi:CO/xanthine dehydrogenase Mo-binding subunit